jgi:hypothetical protein
MIDEKRKLNLGVDVAAGEEERILYSDRGPAGEMSELCDGFRFALDILGA